MSLVPLYLATAHSPLSPGHFITPGIFDLSTKVANLLGACAHTCGCGDFCAPGCGRRFENVRACAWVKHFFGACGRMFRTSIKSLKTIQICAPHTIKMCAIWVRVWPKIRAHYRFVRKALYYR